MPLHLGALGSAFRRPTGRLVGALPLIAACLISGTASWAQGVEVSSPALVASSTTCPAHEDLFRALKLTKSRGSIRVDYQFIAKNEPRWANMDADLVRRLKVKVGDTFCMTQDSGSAEAAANDLD
jgi:hypothetical protein